MTAHGPIAIENFSHLCVGVSDMEASLVFYTSVLGMDVVFDVELDGAGLDAVTGRAGDVGRMVGGLIGGAMVELSGRDIPRLTASLQLAAQSASLASQGPALLASRSEEALNERSRKMKETQQGAVEKLAVQP